MEYSPSGSVSISVLFAMEHQDGAKKKIKDGEYEHEDEESHIHIISEVNFLD
jgi:hypothetical protein